ncbi:hypothetical protein DMH03_33770 [Amycolatopsis sp. WAC 01376]|uniref:DUF6892 domain-containing protein n=1 Tax=Amycolatopsis sp. WAC 01376 TaxID=2203195 RepID=UPI000F7B5543|nr:hypothetical protein [Amycolatopsis sp. WAC 01376]RSM55151.1 hypothetical protein DMH03_33770 [Amycolatopsis sp. WAC 01376]
MFRDFNFKLLVIDKLMYQDKLIQPRFQIADILHAKGATGDLWKYLREQDLLYTVLEEARQYFTDLEITPDQLAAVDELITDGGLDIYHQCSPFWDGEDDLFDVTSLDDLALLPNLRVIHDLAEAIMAVPGAEDTLKARGIAVD